MVTQEQLKFEGYHYRTSSRFGGRVEIITNSEEVTITGIRTGVSVYKSWIFMQEFILFLIIPAIILPLIFNKPIYLLLILGIIFLHYIISAVGAVALWELANVISFTDNQKGNKETFKIIDIKDVKIGKGWERRGLWFVIPYVIPLINKISEGLCISFEAPDSVTSKSVVYAFLLHTKDEAKILTDSIKK